MLNADLLIFGFIEIKVNTEKLNIIMSLFLRNNISSWQKSNGKIIVLYKSKEKAIDLLKENSIDYKVTNEYNILATYIDVKKRIAIFASIIFTIIICTYLSNLVWDIDIEGNNSISDARILSELDKCGLSVGSNWNNIDFGKVETSILSIYPEVSWISLNRSGTIARISIIETNYGEIKEDNDIEYSNIIAKEDCVIEQISVISGTPVVSIGDSVRKGQLLIMGVVTIDGNQTFCNATGTVIGRVNKNLTVEIDRIQTISKIEKNEILALKVKILNFPINIFKKYGNLSNGYDIIEEKEKISLFGLRRLPVEVSKQYRTIHITESYKASDQELIQAASYQMRATMQSILTGTHLNSLKTSGMFTDNGYVMNSCIVYSYDVAEKIEFVLEENEG